MSEDADGSLLDLPAEVVEQVVVELSDRGEKAAAALRTAARLIAQAGHDDTGLRFTESAAYNLREALEAVVTGRTPVRRGVPAISSHCGCPHHALARPVILRGVRPIESGNRRSGPLRPARPPRQRQIRNDLPLPLR